MGRKGKRKRGFVPDDYFTSGPIEFARLGKVMMGRNRATPDEWRAMNDEMAARLPTIVAEIDMLVTQIADQISQLPPERLLQRAWWNFADTIIRLGGKEVRDFDQATSLRMIDYVQSVIASIKPCVPYKDDVSDEDWNGLLSNVQNLFTQLTLSYQICRVAHLRSIDPNVDMDIEEFKFHAETLWMNVRGMRYHRHERQALLDVLAPHNEELSLLFGIDVKSLVGELDKILAKLTRGLQEAVVGLDQLRSDTMSRLADLGIEADSADLDTLLEGVFSDPELAARRDRVAGEIFGLDLFDVENNTAIPTVLIDELAWSPGEEQEFFAAGEFRGWPLRVWPTMKRPFIKINERTLCFDVFSLFDNFYRVLQRVIFRLDPAYKQTWNDRQKQISEELPFTYLERILPEAQVFRSVYYRWRVGGGAAQWCEADGLLIYDDHLFVVEVKGGAFTYTSPATDLQAHINSLNNLVLSPATQGSRFVDYLESLPEVLICDSDHNEIGRLRYADFRNVTICAVTLDSFTEIAARAQHLRHVGIDMGRRSVWVLSIDDFRMYADMFENPLIFLHFIEQRMKAGHSDLVDLNDERDHLGLYFEANDYSLYAAKLMGSEIGKLSFHGYGSKIDDYYNLQNSENDALRPCQDMPPRLLQIVAFLANSNKPGRSRLASFLLDASSAQRDNIARAIDQQLRAHVSLGRTLPMSSYGGHSLTMWCWSPAAPRNAPLAISFTRSVVAARGEQTRLLLELEYSATGLLIDVHWQQIDLAGLSAVELARVSQNAQDLRQSRVIAASERGRIGRNDPCPCGSGKKFKRCCLSSAPPSQSN